MFPACECFQFNSPLPKLNSRPTCRYQENSKKDLDQSMMEPAQHDCPHAAEVPHSRDSRPAYSSAQVRRYMDFIGLPEPYKSSPVLEDAKLALDKEHGLPFLSSLMRYHMAKIPWENVSLHYSNGRDMPLHVDELYENFVEDGEHRGRGGYCFQMNTFFVTVLRGLGYECMTTAARVNTACAPKSGYPNFKGPSHETWTHMAIIATLSNEDYLVDVGMHAWGITAPLPLIGSQTSTNLSISPRTVRLVRGCLAEHTSRRSTNHMWNFEVCNGPGLPWTPTYSFGMIEFLPADYEALSFFVSRSRKSWFTHKLVCGKLLLSDDGTKIVGDLTLYQNILRKRVAGKVVEEVECQSEEERVDVLEKRLGVVLSSSEREAIMLTETQIH